MPYGESGPFFTVARGPVPRDRPVDRSMARDRPSPYGKRGRSGPRSAGACPPRSSESANDAAGRALALHDNVDKPIRHHDNFADRLTRNETLDTFVSEGGFFDRFVCRIGRQLQPIAEFSVNLRDNRYRGLC